MVFQKRLQILDTPPIETWALHPFLLRQGGLMIALTNKVCRSNDMQILRLSHKSHAASAFFIRQDY